jgi:hypothetical protein
VSPLGKIRARLLHAAGVGAAGLTMTALAALEVARAPTAPCPLVSPQLRPEPVRRRSGAPAGGADDAGP